ncbi:MAG: hypothetical protein ABL955_12930 [Elusimicrobiota bacterium]
MRAVFLTTLLALAACGDGASSAKLPNIRLPTLGGPLGPSLASCSTDKCLTVIVAPWCTVCHQVTPEIVRLRRFLSKAGVGSRVVVGLSDLGPIKEMAALFGSDALLDPDGTLAARGVPLFITTNRAGDIVNHFSGFPRAASTPAELASYFGLP